MLPRQTVLTRADSFKAHNEHPIVANAEQMLIVVAVRQPRPKWGLVDRMTVAARGGGLVPIICLNKVDLPDDADEDLATARANIEHYQSLGIDVLETSVIAGRGIAELADKLRGRVTSARRPQRCRQKQPDLRRAAGIGHSRRAGRRSLPTKAGIPRHRRDGMTWRAGGPWLTHRA